MMKKKRIGILTLVFMLFLISGCGEQTEINDRAIELGRGVDINETGDYEISSQLLIPSRIKVGEIGSEKGSRNFFVVTGTGKTLTDALANLQTKVSRRVFRGQRRAIYIGEKVARHGVKDMLDAFTRDPGVRIRSDISVVKGGQAIDLMKTAYPLAISSAFAASQIHLVTADSMGTGLLDFLMEATDKGSSPTMTVIKVKESGSPDNSESPLEFYGRAVFDKQLKLLGYLNYEQSVHRMWMLNRLNTNFITVKVPKDSGYVTFETHHLKGKIEPMMTGHQLTIRVILSAVGTIVENNAHLNLKESQNIRMLEQALNQTTEERVRDTITAVQKQYGTDVFGFSDAVHRQMPQVWARLNKNWPQTFRQANIVVTASCSIRRTGMVGQSIL